MRNVSAEPTAVIVDLAEFDRQSGSLLERLIFNNRPIVVMVCLLLTICLGWEAVQLRVTASFEQLLPVHNSYIQNYLKHESDLRLQGNSLRIVAESQDGTILNRGFLDKLKQLNQDIYLLPGVDQGNMQSIWMPSVRWTAVTPDGLTGDTVMPETYDGSNASIDELRTNLNRSGQVGRLVAEDFRSTALLVPLQRYQQPSVLLNYRQLHRELLNISDTYARQGIILHVTGAAMVLGDMIAGISQILVYFAAAILIAGISLYFYTRCVRSALLVVVCSLVAVLWQLGITRIVGLSLDPYSVLVPFLVFAIGMSHGAQKMNGIMQDVGRGTQKLVAARHTFRRLFMIGLAALVCDAVGFAVLLMIRIQAIQELAIIASVGVAILVFTNLVLLPILLSYVGVSAAAARRSLKAESEDEVSAIWRFFNLFTQRKPALAAIGIGLVLAAGGMVERRKLQVGDLNPGAPELRPNSRYNQDIRYIRAHYATSSDVFVVMVTTPRHKCSGYDVAAKMDDLAWRLQQMPGVQSVTSFASTARELTSGFAEGNLKWHELVASSGTLADVVVRVPREMANRDCSLLPMYVYLTDHKATTLKRVLDAVSVFAAKNDTSNVKFELAAGTAGIDAATNIVVASAMRTMLLWVYAAVILLSFVALRSWRAVVCAILPLMLTSIMAEALTVWLGIGIKVATLPVIALGVGIGVDYALYVLRVMQDVLPAVGWSLSKAYHRTLIFTGRVVLLTGFTLAVGVGTWAFSPIQFQVDMGRLLAFMFIWNMLGALILVPALARFLLIRTPAIKSGTKLFSPEITDGGIRNNL